jgi:hypothetical protein
MLLDSEKPNNQMNETDQTDQIDEIDRTDQKNKTGWWTFLHPASDEGVMGALAA